MDCLITRVIRANDRRAVYGLIKLYLGPFMDWPEYLKALIRDGKAISIFEWWLVIGDLQQAQMPWWFMRSIAEMYEFRLPGPLRCMVQFWINVVSNNRKLDFQRHFYEMGRDLNVDQEQMDGAVFA